MSYSRLDYLKRCKLQAFVQAGYTQQQIAEEIGVHKSTISRELNRNITFVRTRIGYWTYKANYAQKYADDRQQGKPKAIKATDEIKAFIIEKLQQEWSPEPISGYAKRKKLFYLIWEWIYQFILENKKQGGNLFKHLRHPQKKYRKRYGSPKRQGPIRNRPFIDERPKIVDAKTRIGDWEIDTFIGKNRKHAVVSIVERKTKFTILKKVNQKTAEHVGLATIDALKPYNNSVLSITSDNGSEFARHKKIAEQLDVDFFFAHPYSSWERGLNENTNGLVRQYLKKGSSFDSITDEYLKIINVICYSSYIRIYELKMTIEEALRYFNSGYDLCNQLGVAHTNMVRWKKQNFIPVTQQLKINQITGANMPIDLDKVSMEERVNKQ